MQSKFNTIAEKIKNGSYQGYITVDTVMDTVARDDRFAKKIATTIKKNSGGKQTQEVAKILEDYYTTNWEDLANDTIETFNVNSL